MSKLSANETELFEALTVLCSAWNHPEILLARRKGSGTILEARAAELDFKASMMGYKIHDTITAQATWWKYHEKSGLMLPGQVSAMPRKH